MFVKQLPRSLCTGSEQLVSSVYTRVLNSWCIWSLKVLTSAEQKHVEMYTWNFLKAHIILHDDASNGNILVTGNIKSQPVGYLRWRIAQTVRKKSLLEVMSINYDTMPYIIFSITASRIVSDKSIRKEYSERKKVWSINWHVEENQRRRQK